jgi:hypothetical protein
MFSDHQRINISSYQGWRPARAALLLIIGILAGVWVVRDYPPPPVAPILDCSR